MNVLSKSTAIQFNLFVEENITLERFLELKRKVFLFTYEYIMDNKLLGTFEDVCTFEGQTYYRSVSFNNN